MRIDKIRSFHLIFAWALVALCLGAYMITLSEPAEAAGKPCHKIGFPTVEDCSVCSVARFNGDKGACARFPEGDPRRQRCEDRAWGKRDKCELNSLSTFLPD